MKLVRMLFAVSMICPASLLVAQDAAQPAAPAQAETQSAPEPPLESRRINGVTPPKVIHAVDPKYSGEARRKKISGVSVITLVVSADGKPENVRVRRSMADQLPANLHDAAVSLDENAVKAVRKYRFDPATLDGKSVAMEINVEVNYQLL